MCGETRMTRKLLLLGVAGWYFLRARWLGHCICWFKQHSSEWNYMNSLTREQLEYYNDVIMGAIWSQITILTIVYSAIYSGVDQSKHQSSASLAFVRGIHRGPVNSLHKWPVTRKMFSFDDVIMAHECILSTMAINALVLKHLAINIHCADQISIVFVTIRSVSDKNFTFMINNIWKWNGIFEKKKKLPSCLRVELL